MMRPDRAPRLAVLIDADNASPRIVAGLFDEIATIGEASVRRIYGDFSSSRSQGWADVLSRYAIIPHQQFAYVTGKNASDITLVIDAMDLLHSGRLDGFCLVSSDSDFTRLAARIREQGVDVFGFGEKKTPESFRQACRRFIYTENLVPERPGGERAGVARPLEQPETASDLLRRVIEQMDTEDEWVSLGSFGKQLANLASDFDPRTYGFKKLSDLIRSTDAFEVDDADPGRIRVRVKPARDGRRAGPSGGPAAAPAPPRQGTVPAVAPGSSARPAGSGIVPVAADVPMLPAFVTVAPGSVTAPARATPPPGPAEPADAPFPQPADRSPVPPPPSRAPRGATASPAREATPPIQSQAGPATLDEGAPPADPASAPPVASDVAAASSADNRSRSPVRRRAATPRPAAGVEPTSAADPASVRTALALPLSPAALVAHITARDGPPIDRPPPTRSRRSSSSRDRD